MKSILLAMLASASFAHAAAPAAFNGFCMVVQTGNPPGKTVAVQKGQSQEIARVGDLSYVITYADMLDEENVLQLKVLDTTSKKQSVVDVFVENEIPKRIDLVSALGSMMCDRD